MIEIQFLYSKEPTHSQDVSGALLNGNTIPFKIIVGKINVVRLDKRASYILCHHKIGVMTGHYNHLGFELSCGRNRFFFDICMRAI